MSLGKFFVVASVFLFAASLWASTWSQHPHYWVITGFIAGMCFKRGRDILWKERPQVVEVEVVDD